MAGSSLIMVFIGAITKSLDPDCSEFIIHVDTDYDYRFLTVPETLNDILYVLKHWYYEIHKKNLEIFGVDYSTLKDFTTTKKDAQKRVSKKPPRNYLLKEENLFHKKRKTNRRTKSKLESFSAIFQ